MDNKKYYKDEFERQFKEIVGIIDDFQKEVDNKINVSYNSAIAAAEQEYEKIRYSTFIGFGAICLTVVSIVISICIAIGNVQDFSKLCFLTFIPPLVVLVIITVIFHYRTKPDKNFIRSILKSRAIDEAIKYAEKIDTNNKKEVNEVSVESKSLKHDCI